MSEAMRNARITRRRLLALTGAAGVGIVAAACAPKVVVQTVVVEKEKLVEVEKAVVQTVVVEKEKVVEKAVEKIVERTVVVKEAAKVQGTLQIIQKKDFFQAMNDWWRNETLAFCKEQGWPVDVTYEAGYVGGTPFFEKLSAAAAAGTPADLIMHDASVTQLKQLQIVDPVDDLVDEVSAVWGSPSARQKFDFVIDGRWWVIPYFQRSDGGWYQKPVFDAKGIDVAKIRLYPELWEACLAVSDPSKELYGWGVTLNRSNDSGWFMGRVTHGWGAYYTDETGQFVTIDTPEWVEAMTVMTDLYMNKKWEPMLAPGILAWTDSSNNETYLAGKLAYTQNGGTVFGKAILDNNPIKDITRFHSPAGGPVNTEFNSLSANYIALLKGARNQDAARDVARHYLLPLESQDGIFANAPAFALPAYEKLWDASKYIPTNPVAQDQKAVATSPSGNIVPGTYPGPSGNIALSAADQSMINDDMVSEILAGTPVADAVKTCHERYVAVFKEHGYAGAK